MTAIITEAEFGAALRLCGLDDMGAVTLSDAEKRDLSDFAGSFAAGIFCPAHIANHARGLLARHADVKATPEQVENSRGTAAQKFVRAADATGKWPTRADAEQAGFRFVEQIRPGQDLLVGPDGSRLAISASRLNAMPAD